MNNGTAMKVLVDGLNEYAADHSSLDYYQQPLPAEFDGRLDLAVKEFMAIDAAGRETFQSSLSPDARSLFGIYGHRAATRAVRENSQELVKLGLVAAVIANYVVPEHRRVEVGLAVYHHAAAKLGLSPPDLFSKAAACAGEALAAQLRAFGSRGDVTLKRYGWKEIQTADGVQYKFNWK
jgi:hypothetical protein